MRLNQLDLFDAVLQTHTVVFWSHRAASHALAWPICVAFDRDQHQFDGPPDLARIGVDPGGYHDALAGQDPGIWSDVEVITGRATAHQRRVS